MHKAKEKNNQQNSELDDEDFKEIESELIANRASAIELNDKADHQTPNENESTISASTICNYKRFCIWFKFFFFNIIFTIK